MWQVIWIIGLSLVVVLIMYFWAESWAPMLDTTLVEKCPRLNFIDSGPVNSDAYVRDDDSKKVAELAEYPGAVSVVGRAVVYPSRLLVEDPDSKNGIWEFNDTVSAVVWLSDKHLAVLAGKEHEKLLLLTVSHSPIYTRRVHMPKVPEGQVPMSITVENSILKVFCGRPDLYTPDMGGTVFRYEILK